MSGITVTICSSCPAGRAGFASRLQAALSADVEVQEVECMSGCTRPSTVAVRAAGKTAYLFGDLDQGDIPALVTFVALYGKTSDGNFSDARPLGELREKAIARIPG